jgi:hypothetical protein
MLVEPSPTPTSGPLHAQQRVGWQPSRFLADRAEAERAFQLAEQLGSVNAAAKELGTTWPSLRKAFIRHGLGMPARNPEAVRQRTIAGARYRNGQPAPPTMPPLDPVFVALNRGQLPPPRGSQPEQGVRLRRSEEIETLSYRTVVAFNQESRLAPGGRIATIAGRAERAKRLASDRAGRADRRHAERAARTGRSSRVHQPQDRGILTDAR